MDVRTGFVASAVDSMTVRSQASAELDTSTILAAAEAVVRRTGEHPTVGQVAAELRVNPLTLRRRWRSMGRTALRDLVVYACLTHARALILDGTKVEAAMLLSGFRHYSNFCRQFRAFFGDNPSACRPDRRRGH